MNNVFRGMFLAAALAGLGLMVPCGRVAAEGKPEKITTVDGVELHGMFYQSPKAKAPTIILLHAIGDSGMKKSYVALAEALQPEYSVMTFDFRGHGKSKDIDPMKFWAVQLNKQLIKGASPKKTTIEYADFAQAKDYFPVLVNDIAAVKAFLDRNHNDPGDCNTSSTILIGAETGATLGAIWLNSQWSLQRMIPNPNNPMFPPVPAADPEGKDVIACIWLSISPSLGAHKVKLSDTLKTAVKVNATATVFMYGEKDDKNDKLSITLANELREPKNPRYDYVKSYEVKKTKSPGISLVQKALGTEKDILDYLEVVVDKRGREWTKRDFRTSQYNWRAGGGLVPAKGTDPNNLLFNSYESFIGR
jgi:alpha-beta hydrolase superfamily lysophospholipase